MTAMDASHAVNVWFYFTSYYIPKKLLLFVLYSEWVILKYVTNFLFRHLSSDGDCYPLGIQLYLIWG